jgi:hypothetical protein
MHNFRANQKAFALFTSAVFGLVMYLETWTKTSPLLKVLEFSFLIGLYFFTLFSFKFLSDYLANKQFFRKMGMFSYYVEYSVKTFTIVLFIFGFHTVHKSIIGQSDHVKEMAKSKCYKTKKFHSCYNHFQLAVKGLDTEQTQLDFSLAHSQCLEGNEKFCSHYVRMVDSYDVYKQKYKVEALEAALRYQTLLSQKALLSEIYSIALSMNGKHKEAIAVQKGLITYAENNAVSSYSIKQYKSTLNKFEKDREPAAKQVKKK